MSEWAITTDTGISLTLLVVIISCTVTIVRKMTTVQRDVSDLKTNQYTITMACEQALRTAIANPGMKVADPRNPEKIIVVEQAG